MGRRPRGLSRHGARLGGMKLNPPFAVLMLVCFSLAALAMNRERQTRIRNAQCEVALAYLQGLTRYESKPWLLVELPEEAVPMEDLQHSLEQNPSWKDNPDFKIEIQKAKIAHLSPVKICSNVRKWAAQNRIRIEPGYLGRASSVRPDWLIPNYNDEYDWHIIKLSMPVISDDGRRAYLNESQFIGPFGGGGNALEYRKKSDGSWILVKRIGRYIS